mmetsp:Transcript_98933/g.236059  ORF Transcript_98933/g.236059 Transcript_98933/m.236059 type:complete len:359 (-) Transcript_98933:2425-3501(-)
MVDGSQEQGLDSVVARANGQSSNGSLPLLLTERRPAEAALKIRAYDDQGHVSTCIAADGHAVDEVEVAGFDAAGRHSAHVDPTIGVGSDGTLFDAEGVAFHVGDQPGDDQLTLLHGTVRGVDTGEVGHVCRASVEAMVENVRVLQSPVLGLKQRHVADCALFRIILLALAVLPIPAEDAVAAGRLSQNVELSILAESNTVETGVSHVPIDQVRIEVKGFPEPGLRQVRRVEGVDKGQLNRITPATSIILVPTVAEANRINLRPVWRDSHVLGVISRYGVVGHQGACVVQYRHGLLIQHGRLPGSRADTHFAGEVLRSPAPHLTEVGSRHIHALHSKRTADHQRTFVHHGIQVVDGHVA